MNIYKLEDISELPFDTAVTVGMFDGVHVGHRHILKMIGRVSAEQGLRAVVVTFDCHPRQVLNAESAASFRVNTNEERYRLLEECGVAEVVEVHFSWETAQLSACEFFEEVLLRRLRCKALVLGYDNMFGNRQRNDFDRLPALAESRGVNVTVDTPLRVDGVEVSSTQVRKALQRGDVHHAATLLGYPYRLWGTVVKGRQVGRTLGFPTANVCLDDSTKVVPTGGVYAVRVFLPDGGGMRLGMANFGAQPTFGLEKTVFEVNIFDYDGDLYDKVLTRCFRHPAVILGIAFAAVGFGVFLFTRLQIQMLPKADRNCFAVEMHLAEGSTLQQTEAVADSMEHVLRADPRVTSVTSFIGCSSPRFHATYAPQMAHKNYAQFIVNTTSEENTLKLIREYGPKYEYHFPNAYVRFKQIDYQAVSNPVEVRFSGNDFGDMKTAADSLKNFLNTMPELTWVHSDMDETSQNIRISLKSDEATRLGVTQSMLSLYLSSALGGQNLTNVWEGDYKVPVMLYTQKDGDTLSYQEMEDFLIPTSIPGTWVPLRQVAEVGPEWHDAVINRRNSIRTVTVGADLKYGYSQPEVMDKIDRYLKKTSQPEGVEITYGGLTGINGQVIPQIALSFFAAVLVLFIFLLYHFGRLDIVFLTLSASLICVFGACLGLWIFGLDFSITAVLGVVSLIGIIVRNAIIMFEYAEDLRRNHHLSSKEAGFEAGKRRMRPIFLTSATTALGVMPMIVAHTNLWMPMGVVICFGTIFSLPLVVTVLPVTYWQIFKNSEQ